MGKLQSVAVATSAAITNNLEAQVTRDLLILNAEFGICVYDPESKVPDHLLNTLNIQRTTEKPVLYLSYKTGDDWPVTPENIPTVKRDLKPSELRHNLDGSGQDVGYFLPKEQGRYGPALTQIYLNRAAPQGRGNPNPAITLTWG